MMGKTLRKLRSAALHPSGGNLILEDFSNRLDYMERQGSGLMRIKESFDDESWIEFFSNQSNFFVAMKKQWGDENTDFINERFKTA